MGLVLLAPAAHAEPPSRQFTETWVGSDPAPPDGDGSTVHLVITGGPAVRIAFTDEFETVCVDEGASDTLFTSILTGKVDGDILVASLGVDMGWLGALADHPHLREEWGVDAAILTVLGLNRPVSRNLRPRIHPETGGVPWSSGQCPY